MSTVQTLIGQRPPLPGDPVPVPDTKKICDMSDEVDILLISNLSFPSCNFRPFPCDLNLPVRTLSHHISEQWSIMYLLVHSWHENSWLRWLQVMYKSQWEFTELIAPKLHVYLGNIANHRLCFAELMESTEQNPCSLIFCRILMSKKTCWSVNVRHFSFTVIQ